MSKEMFNCLKDDYKLKGITPDYSGKCMYGQTCFGLTGTSMDWIKALNDIIN